MNRWIASTQMVKQRAIRKTEFTNAPSTSALCHPYVFLSVVFTDIWKEIKSSIKAEGFHSSITKHWTRIIFGLSSYVSCLIQDASSGQLVIWRSLFIFGKKKAPSIALQDFFVFHKSYLWIVIPSVQSVKKSWRAIFMLLGEKKSRHNFLEGGSPCSTVYFEAWYSIHKEVYMDLHLKGQCKDSLAMLRIVRGGNCC